MIITTDTSCRWQEKWYPQQYWHDINCERRLSNFFFLESWEGLREVSTSLGIPFLEASIIPPPQQRVSWLGKDLVEVFKTSRSHPRWLAIPSQVPQLTCRVAGVEGAQERRSPKGQGLLRKEGPPTYAILWQKLVLSRFTLFLKGFRRAFHESHPALTS